MIVNPTRVACRTVGEWAVRSAKPYDNPFLDVRLDATFALPSGEVTVVPAFYDGDGTWRVRFRPGQAGVWRYTISAWPPDPGLHAEGAFEVERSDERGKLCATPGQAWGFRYESGEPAFLLGDTTYNLFGMAHCGGDVQAYLRRRAGQGFNIFRVRLQVSPFHPPDGYSVWQTRGTWPWGGSEQSPRFDRFNLDYFRTVDGVVQAAEGLGVGFEMIAEAWGFEFPFNRREVFLPECEELWLRYLAARYDAYNSVYVWTLMNEYEFYPDGDPRHSVAADRWAMRVARWLKALAPHGHPIAIHNTRQQPPFARRFAADPGAIDAVMYQEWGSGGADDGWLAAGIEDQVAGSFAGWPGCAVFAEYGYERNLALPITFPSFAHCDASHTRRGAWRGACCAMGVINGFENTWGPVMDLEHDQEGVRYLQLVRRFFMQVVPFEALSPAPRLVVAGAYGTGRKPLALASPERELVAVYFPAGGSAVLDLPLGQAYIEQHWYDPRTGALCNATPSPDLPGTGGLVRYATPGGVDAQGRPLDWVLALCTTSSGGGTG